MTTPISRRDAIRRTALATCAALALPACLPAATEPARSGDPRLSERPGTPMLRGTHGMQTFPVTNSSATAYVPEAVTRTEPAGLMLFLHGAGRSVQPLVDAHRTVADESRVIVLAPYAVSGTWDAIHGGFRHDPGVIDAALRHLFERWTIDPRRVAMSGFSDGATYALAVGRANGSLFSRIVAYAPGSLIDVERDGRPPVMIAHGTADAVLPIDITSRRIVPALRKQGYAVDYREFDGPHAVSGSLLRDAVRAIGTA